MSRDRNYQRLLNDKRWKTIRAAYLQQHPLCERCRREGIAAGVLPDGWVTAAVDVHHKQPVERARSVQEMELLCYDFGNLEALCIPCHIKTHKEMRSHTREEVKANKDRARRRFIEMNDPNYKAEDNGTGTMEAD